MRPARLVPLYLLLLFPLLTSSRPVYATQWEATEKREQSAAAPQPSLSPGEVRDILRQPGPGDEVVYEWAGASGTGAGVSANGEKIDAQHTGSPPRASLTDVGNSEGGGSSTNFHISALNHPSVVRIICGVLAVACLIGAGLSVWRQWRLPVLPVKLALGAVGFGVCAWFPDVAIAILAGYIIIEIADTLFGGQMATRTKEALRAVVAGVSDVPADVGEAVRKSIKAHADDADKKTIAGVKFKDGLK